MYTIRKEFSFCYGHRVWSQKLNPEFSLDNSCKCRHLHGHEGKVEIILESDGLQSGMVTDFKHLNWFKKFLDDFLDHKMILDINDPSLFAMYPFLLHQDTSAYIEHVVEEVQRLVQDKMEIHSEFPLKSIKPELYKGFLESYQEVLQGLVFVNFVPTSENLSKFFFEIIQEKMKPILKQSIKLREVSLYETPKSKSSYCNY